MPRIAEGVAPQLDENVELAGTPEKSEPVYDASMDPGSPNWNPKKYFGAQEKVMVYVHRDPSDMARDPNGKVIIYKPFSINNYTLNIPTGVSVWVPKDFADYIVETGMGISQSSSQVYRVE